MLNLELTTVQNVAFRAFLLPAWKLDCALQGSINVNDIAVDLNSALQSNTRDCDPTDVERLLHSQFQLLMPFSLDLPSRRWTLSPSVQTFQSTRHTILPCTRFNLKSAQSRFSPSLVRQ